MYKLTNLGQSVRVIHDKLNRTINIQPATTVACDLPDSLVKMLKAGMEKGGDLKIVEYDGTVDEPEKELDFPPDKPVVDDSQGKMHDGAPDPEADAMVQPKPKPAAKKPERVRLAKKPFKATGRRIDHKVLDDGAVKDPNKMTASQVLAQVGKQGFTYTDLLKHGRRILGADSLPPRPSEHDLLQRLRRHAVSSGK